MNIRDQIGHDVVLNSTPTRIISLVPSQSELLHYLGCEKSMIGITRFCTHPKELRKNVKIIGGTKDLDFENIKLLKRYISDTNKILPSRITSVCQGKQRKLTNEIKKAKILGLL